MVFKDQSWADCPSEEAELKNSQIWIYSEGITVQKSLCNFLFSTLPSHEDAFYLPENDKRFETQISLVHNLQYQILIDGARCWVNARITVSACEPPHEVFVFFSKELHFWTI